MMDEADKKKFQNVYDDASPTAQEKIQAVMREYGITHRELTEEESDQAGQKIADILRNDKAQRDGQRRSLTSMLRILRENGWMVGVHNDYRQGGKLMTFWLFTHPSPQQQRHPRRITGKSRTDTTNPNMRPRR